jgi:uncharacterized membrane protein
MSRRQRRTATGFRRKANADAALPDSLSQLLERSSASLPYASGCAIATHSSAIATSSVAHMQLWEGPFPPPEAIEAYERVLPGAFARMIQMAEQSQAAQIEETRRAQDYARCDMRRGHWLGFLSTLSALVAAVGATVAGFPWVGVAFVSVPVMGVAKALIDSARKFSAQPEGKRMEPPRPQADLLP